MISVVSERVEALAAHMRENPLPLQRHNWYSYMEGGEEMRDRLRFPRIDHPYGPDFFFFLILHDYGLWFGDDKGYVAPLYGYLYGQRCKGSDLTTQAILRYFIAHPSRFEPRYLRDMSPETLFRKIFVDDNGAIPLPDADERLARTRAYGRWMDVNRTNPRMIMAACQEEGWSLDRFIAEVSHIPGFDRDPLRKRPLLLALALSQRPERYLRLSENTQWPPIVDFHLMRLALRTGMVVLGGATSERDNVLRQYVSPSIEYAIRSATYEAVELLARLSGIHMADLDQMLWQARSYCPEMTAPRCAECYFSSVCAQEKDLFQPVIRTTAY